MHLLASEINKLNIVLPNWFCEILVRLPDVNNYFIKSEFVYSFIVS